MTKIEARHEVEVLRMYDELKKLEPGTPEYDAVLSQITKARSGENEAKKIENDRETAKKDRYIKIVTIAGTALVVPIVDLLCKRNLAKFIGTVEQMEYFVSSAGKSISSWFRWK